MLLKSEWFLAIGDLIPNSIEQPANKSRIIGGHRNGHFDTAEASLPLVLDGQFNLLVHATECIPRLRQRKASRLRSRAKARRSRATLHSIPNVSDTAMVEDDRITFKLPLHSLPDH